MRVSVVYPSKTQEQLNCNGMSCDTISRCIDSSNKDVDSLMEERTIDIRNCNDSPFGKSDGGDMVGGWSSPSKSSPGGHSARLTPPRDEDSVEGDAPSYPDTEKEFSFTPQAYAMVNKQVGEVSDGVDYLMKSCTHMLKKRIGLPATPLPERRVERQSPDIALDAVGPVLETVLSNLTREYERRLLSKDEERKMLVKTIDALKQQSLRLQEEVHALKCRDAQNKESIVVVEGDQRDKEVIENQECVIAGLNMTVHKLEQELALKETELHKLRQAHATECQGMAAKLEDCRNQIQMLAGFQDKYASVQKENRTLYNMVQDLRGAIRVYCRVRPCGATGDSSASVVETEEELGSVSVFSQKHNKWHEYKFDRVFNPSSTQDAVYMETKPLIRSVLDGYNVCIFAYGQTGSGKTHTMSGTDEDPGINPRALQDLFRLRDERQGEENYSFKVQLLEIYNETVRDLLSDEGISLKIVNTRASGSNVPGARQVVVTSAKDVAQVLEFGSRNRSVGETKMNDRSSRSHQVLTVIVEGEHQVTRAKSHGCLHLIDLAGSERITRSGAEGVRLTEAQHINKSLTALGCVMQALAQKRDYIPFRDSKLTQLLQDSLSGQAKSMMFVHVAPEQSSGSESFSTLNFAKGVTEITLGAATKNQESGTNVVLREKLAKAEQEILKMKEEMQGIKAHRPPRRESGLSSAGKSMGSISCGQSPMTDRRNSNSRKSSPYYSTKASRIPTPNSFR